jgi:hypothetical protein
MTDEPWFHIQYKAKADILTRERQHRAAEKRRAMEARLDALLKSPERLAEMMQGNALLSRDRENDR